VSYLVIAVYIQSSQLDVGVLVPYPLLQCAHGISRLHRFGSNNVGYFEVEGHILSIQSKQGSSQLDIAIGTTYKLDDVARSICSSSAPAVEDPNQPAMVSDYSRRRVVCVDSEDCEVVSA
jgi:hypothetical protein